MRAFLSFLILLPLASPVYADKNYECGEHIGSVQDNIPEERVKDCSYCESYLQRWWMAKYTWMSCEIGTGLAAVALFKGRTIAKMLNLTIEIDYAEVYDASVCYAAANLFLWGAALPSLVHSAMDHFFNGEQSCKQACYHDWDEGIESREQTASQ